VLRSVYYRYSWLANKKALRMLLEEMKWVIRIVVALFFSFVFFGAIQYLAKCRLGHSRSFVHRPAGGFRFCQEGL